MKNELKVKKDLTKQEIYAIIIAYLDEQVDLSLREMRTNVSFSKPAWSEHQAYQLGMQKAFLKFREFVPALDQGVALD